MIQNLCGIYEDNNPFFIESKLSNNEIIFEKEIKMTQNQPLYEIYFRFIFESKKNRELFTSLISLSPFIEICKIFTFITHLRIYFLNEPIIFLLLFYLTSPFKNSKYPFINDILNNIKKSDIKLSNINMKFETIDLTFHLFLEKYWSKFDYYYNNFLNINNNNDLIVELPQILFFNKNLYFNSLYKKINLNFKKIHKFIPPKNKNVLLNGFTFNEIIYYFQKIYIKPNLLNEPSNLTLNQKILIYLYFIFKNNFNIEINDIDEDLDFRIIDHQTFDIFEIFPKEIPKNIFIK